MLKLGRPIAFAGLLLALGAGTAWAGVVAPPVSVPEPATLGLLAAGIAGIAGIRRLRRRK